MRPVSRSCVISRLQRCNTAKWGLVGRTNPNKTRKQAMHCFNISSIYVQNTVPKDVQLPQKRTTRVREITASEQKQHLLEEVTIATVRRRFQVESCRQNTVGLLSLFICQFYYRFKHYKYKYKLIQNVFNIYVIHFRH